MEIRRQRKARGIGSRRKGLTAEQKRDAVWEGYQAQINRLRYLTSQTKSHEEQIKLTRQIQDLEAKQRKIRGWG